MPSSQPLVSSYDTIPTERLAALVRVGIDAAKAEQFVIALECGAMLPAVFVLYDGIRWSILDGHHRVAAWSRRGIAEVRAVVFRPGALR
jgi:hypothetical protein